LSEKILQFRSSQMDQTVAETTKFQAGRMALEILALPQEVQSEKREDGLPLMLRREGRVSQIALEK